MALTTCDRLNAWRNRSCASALLHRRSGDHDGAMGRGDGEPRSGGRSGRTAVPRSLRDTDSYVVWNSISMHAYLGSLRQVGFDMVQSVVEFAAVDDQEHEGVVGAVLTAARKSADTARALDCPRRAAHARTSSSRASAPMSSARLLVGIMLPPRSHRIGESSALVGRARWHGRRSSISAWTSDHLQRSIT